MFEINRDIPIPPASERREGRGSPIYPFKRLGFGESFLAPVRSAAKVKDAAKHYRSRNPGWNYYARVEEDGVRVWRTA